jgi:1-deoxy-D-xylulose-5-phosphate reductoisomerase
MSKNAIKTLAILGSTGSIGRSTLEVVRAQPERFRVAGLAAGRNVDELARQVCEFRPAAVSVADALCRSELVKRLRADGFDPAGVEIGIGPAGARAVVTQPPVDMVVAAMVGVSGLAPTYAAIQAGKHIALANKETLVAAGHLVMAAVAERGVRLLPVDSEHNAIFQCLHGEDRGSVRRIWLTASGGPFLRRPAEEFAAITPDDALRHPTWRMGPKITIDSATLMNKGLEVIEAHWLFGLPPDAIRVVVHPQSTIHSMVEFVDGSILAQLGVTDMKLPIAYALHYPERRATGAAELDLFRLRALEFLEPDVARFRCLPLAYEALRHGGTAPAVLNAANEIAVEAFLGRLISFPEIPEVIRRTMDAVSPTPCGSIEELLELDAKARSEARRIVNEHPNAR